MNQVVPLTWRANEPDYIFVVGPDSCGWGGCGGCNVTISASPPSNPTNGQLWYDTADNQLNIFNGWANMWVPISGPGGGGPTSINVIPPTNPTVGQLWFDAVGQQMYIWYNDGATSQWVPVTNTGVLALPTPSMPTTAGTWIWNGGSQLWVPSSQELGVTDGSSAAPGMVGEIMEGWQAINFTSITVQTGTVADYNQLMTMTLPTGDWNVQGWVESWSTAASPNIGPVGTSVYLGPQSLWLSVPPGTDPTMIQAAPSAIQWVAAEQYLPPGDGFWFSNSFSPIRSVSNSPVVMTVQMLVGTQTGPQPITGQVILWARRMR